MWPEFLYSNMSIKEYVQEVQDKEFDVKEEICGLLKVIQEFAREGPTDATKMIAKTCEAIAALLELL